MDALVRIDLGDNLVIQVQVAPGLDARHRTADKILDPVEAFLQHPSFQSTDELLDNAEAVAREAGVFLPSGTKLAVHQNAANEVHFVIGGQTNDPADEDLHDLIAERYEQTATIVTSTLDFTEWDQAFPANRLLASATLDRLRHNAYCMVLDGQSYRAPKLSPVPVKVRQAVAAAPKNGHA